MTVMSTPRPTSISFAPLVLLPLLGAALLTGCDESLPDADSVTSADNPLVVAPGTLPGSPLTGVAVAVGDAGIQSGSGSGPAATPAPASGADPASAAGARPTSLTTGQTRQVPVNLDSGRRPDVRLSEDDAEWQRSLVPSDFHNHPEMGFRNVGDPAGTVELLNMRTTRTRYLMNRQSEIIAQTAQIETFVPEGRFMVHAAPRLTAQGGDVIMNGAWIDGRISRGLEQGIQLEDPLGTGHDLTLLDELTFTARTATEDVALPLPSSAPAIEGSRVRFQGGGLTTTVDTLLDSVGYGFEATAQWRDALPADTTEIRLTQRVALGEGWVVQTESVPGELGGPISQPQQTCAAIVIQVPGANPINIRPPVAWDANETFRNHQGRPTYSFGCGDYVHHEVAVENGVMELSIVLDGTWLLAENRAFPVNVDPYWTFRRDANTGTAPAGATTWTATGWLDDYNNVNRPATEQSGVTWVGWYGGLLAALGRAHFTVQGLAEAAASAPGGGNVEYFTTFIGTNYAMGDFRSTHRPLSSSSGVSWFNCVTSGGGYGCRLNCPAAPSTYRWPIVEFVSYQDFRCTSGSGVNCGWSNQIDGAFGVDYRGGWSTRWQSGIPFAGWDSPIHCNLCSGQTFTESATCTEAGATMNDACRTFRPATNGNFTVTGNLTGGDRDHYGFQIPAGRSAQTTFTISRPDGTCSGFDPVLELWYVNQSSGVTQLRDSIDDDEVTGSPCPTWSMYGYLPEGSYSIAVRGFSYLDQGPYRLNVAFADNPSGTVGIGRFETVGLGHTVSPTYDWLGPDAATNLFWSETLLPDLATGYSAAVCQSFYVQGIGSVVYRPFPDFVPYVELKYVGRITNSPTNLGTRPMSEAECAAFGQGQGCGLLWSWDAAAKAVWYNLLGGVGRIDDINGLEYSEAGLAENTRYTRSIEGENEASAGPVSASVTRATGVHVPTASEVTITQGANPAEFSIGATAPPNILTGTHPAGCSGTTNCTAIRYQVRQCSPYAAACASDAACGTIAGQAGTCYQGQCVADSGWTRATSLTWLTSGWPCYEVRATYQNQDGVQAEGWSPWAQRTMTTLVPPTMAAPTCARMLNGSVNIRWTDASVGELGFRLYPNATSTSAFITELSTTASTTGTAYTRSQPAAGAAGNVQVTAVGRSYTTSGGFNIESEPSSQVTYNTLSRAPYSTELRFDAVRANAIDITVVSAENRPCEGLAGARVERCLGDGTGCVALTTPPAAAPGGCASRGYGQLWEFNGGTLAGVGDGQIFDSGLAANTTYEYRMWYANSSGCLSNTYTAYRVTTLPAGPCCYDPANPSNIASTNCQGVCSGGSIACSGSTAATCYCAPPATYSPTETCDNRDNNCDGVVDQITTPATNTQGECSGNTLRCTAGVFNPSPGNYVPTAETCDNRDNDCDGARDENTSGGPLSQSCYSGAAGTAGVGVCRAGTQTCGSGSWSACAGQVTPTIEQCNLADDDCDGTVDDSIDGGFCLGGRDDCSGVTPTGPAGACIDGCRIGTSVCDAGVLFCDIEPAGPVLDVATTIEDVAQGADFNVANCDNTYTNAACGASASLTFVILNEGQLPVGPDVVASFYLDYGTASETLLAGPFPLGRAIPLDGTGEFTFCWFNTVAAAAPENRTLSVVVYNPDDPDTCIDEAQIGDEQPAVLVGPAAEQCDGVDNDCDGLDDVRDSTQACANSVGDSTLSCRNTEFAGWQCIAE